MITFERFEAAKIKRFIQRYGKSYDFKRPELNTFGDPTGVLKELCSINGVYHEASYKHLMPTIANAGVHTQTIEPMIICMNDQYSASIKNGDVVFINSKKYKVSKVKDINDSGFAFDFSLEYIDDGNKA